MPGADPYSAAAMAGIQVWSGIQQADMIRQGAQLQGRIDQINAKYVDLDAWKQEKLGQEQAAKEETRDQQTIGSQRVEEAATGSDTGYGTAASLQNQSKLNSLLNVMDITQAAHQKALGLENQALNIRLGIGQEELRAAGLSSEAMTQGILGGIGQVGGYGAKKLGYSSGLAGSKPSSTGLDDTVNTNLDLNYDYELGIGK